MNSDVPADFPQEFLGAVSGAQPKLLVGKNERGEYFSESAVRRAERWAICVDLCEQLVDYVNEHLPVPESVVAYADRVGRAVQGKRTEWGISIAEVEWIRQRLRARVQDGV